MPTLSSQAKHAKMFLKNIKKGPNLLNLFALESWPNFHASNAPKSAKMTFLNVTIAKMGTQKLYANVCIRVSGMGI